MGPFLSRYTILEQISEDNRMRIYRGYTIEGQRPVIIKKLKEESVNLIEVSRLMHEYEITRDININGIIKPIALEQGESGFALVIEDIGAITLRKYIQEQSIGLTAFLEIAIQLVQTLGLIHQNGIIHGNLRPENIFIETATRKVFIGNFSSSTHLSDSINNRFFNISTDTPEYISPEQTGRLKIRVDQRSDIYSLGIIFYEMITGQLPIQAESSFGWIHAHLTQKPQPPNKIKADIPLAVSNIIMKQLEKAVDKRYQSAYGLLWDLKECRRRLTDTGRIDVFPIGTIDVFASFKIPHKLYGREMEKRTLKTAFERACKGLSQAVFISGYPGVGKTMLVNEGLKSIVPKKGYFISGKSDQLEKNIPYAPFAEAFGSLILRIIAESHRELEYWKNKIIEALGRNAAVITDIIPELEYIIGKQPPVDELPPKEAENRFLMAFRDFVNVFAWKGHPLILFLDDLQWADSACVHLIKYLINDADIHSFLFIGAFRENEVKEGHPLMEVLKNIRDEESDNIYISLMPLDRKQTAELINDTLHVKSSENTASLSEILYLKSGGNPFFLKQLIMLIYNEGLLYFDIYEGCWKWRIDTIKELQIVNDVIEIFLRKLQNFPEETRQIMVLAACIGNKFDLETLAVICDKSIDEITSCLMPAILEGLILEAEDQALINTEERSTVFEFLHDRVQQAVYSLISEEEKKEKHLTIARLLLERTPCDSLKEKILTIMDHFNRSLDFIDNPEEMMKLAEYNLLAGRKAKDSAAYALALQYFRYGKALLPEGAWELAYRISYDLHLELAQAEYLSANMETAERLFDTVIEKARAEEDRASIYGLNVILFASMGKYAEAVNVGIRALRNLGVKVPIHPTKLNYIKELLLYKWHMRNKKIEDLIHMPEIEDPVERKIAELLSRLCSVTLTNYPDLFSLIILKTGNYGIQHGNTEMSCVGYVGYGITAGSILGDYKAGNKFGKISIKLAEKYKYSPSLCIVYFVVGALVSHWSEHASNGLEYLYKAVNYGMEAGDLLMIGYAHCFILEIQYFLGLPLDEMAEVVKGKHELARKLKHGSLGINAAIYERVVSALRGSTEDTKGAKGISLFEQQDGEFMQMMNEDQTSLATYYFHRMYFYYMEGNYRDALSVAKEIESLIGSIIGLMISAEYIFYYSLIIVSIYDELSHPEKKHYRKVLKKNQKQMKKWADACEENFLHKYLLVEAEIARLKRKTKEAMELYDKAIYSAEENGYIQNAALANELAARFYGMNGMNKIENTYIKEAFNNYKKWGAAIKVKELMDRYPDLLIEDKSESTEQDITRLLGSLGAIYAESYYETAGDFDMDRIGKLVESFSKETDLNKLLDSFLDTALQIANADKGYLILEENGDLFVEAAKNYDNSLKITKPILLEDCNDISKAVVQYVALTLESIILDCGVLENKEFITDPYISKTDSSSIACLPLLFQGIPIGVIYLENSLMDGVFTPEHLAVLKLFSNQLAFVKKLQSYIQQDALDEEKTSLYLVDPLTEREIEVIKLIADGMSNKEISDKLEITMNTVKGHIKNIYQKLGVSRRVQAVNKARELNII